MRKLLEQKEKIIYDLRIELAQKKALIEEMKEEIAQKRDHIAHLEGTLQQLDEDADRLRDLIKEKDLQIQDLEDQLAKMNEKPPTPEPEPEEPEPLGNYVADNKDEVDVMLAKFINMNNCPVPIKRLGGGYYLFGTKKIYAKILNDRLVIRVGGGYMIAEEFIATYAEQELIKLQKLLEKEGVTEYEDLEFVQASMSPGSRRSDKQRSK